MKTKLFLLAALLMATTVHANTGSDDTLKAFRIHFSQKLDIVQFSGYCKVEIVNDSVEYLEYCDPSISERPKGMTYETGENRYNYRLKLNTPPGCPRLRLHLLMEASTKISTEDYAQVDLLCPANMVKMSVWAEDYSKVNVAALPGIDTLRARHIVLKAEDYSTVTMQTPCVLDEIGLRADDYANISVAFCKGNKLVSTENDHGRVDVASCQMEQTEFSAIIQDGEDESTIDKLITDNKSSRLKQKVNSYSSDFRFDFLWGFHNWGTTPFNGLMRMQDGYALNTTFSSYQLEAVYYPFVNNHWRLGVGLGYGSDVYKFSDDYVAVADDITGTMQTFVASDPHDGGTWSTKLTARYITLPLMVRWEPGNSDFFIGLAAIPGLNYNGKHTGLKHKAEYPNGTYNDKDNLSKMLNPFRLDARLSIGWENIYAFLQVATLPVNTGMDQAVYPIKLGLALSLGDD